MTQLLLIFFAFNVRVTNSYQGEGFMVGVKINPVPGLPSGFQVILNKNNKLIQSLALLNNK